MLLVLGATPVAGAEVTRAEIGSAEAEAGTAVALLRSTQDRLDEAQRRRDLIADSLVRVGEQIVARELELGVGRERARERLAGMYMRADARGGLIVLSGRAITDLPTQVAYLGALADEDREVISELAASRADLVRLTEEIRASLEAQEAVVADLAAEVETRIADVEAAQSRVDGLEAQWQREEEERRRRAEEERRRQEEEARRQAEAEEAARQEAEAALAAAAAAAAAEGWKPGAGVEPWRGLVRQYFPDRLVEEAMRVMKCESGGNPLAVNPYSGASGLFQHLPYYWPSRTEKAGWSGADIFDGEANIAVSAWLVDQSERAGKDSWSHWSCKP
jgi:peptidoglycan hydrolase CwlO-like protein